MLDGAGADEEETGLLVDEETGLLEELDETGTLEEETGATVELGGVLGEPSQVKALGPIFWFQKIVMSINDKNYLGWCSAKEFGRC